LFFSGPPNKLRRKKSKIILLPYLSFGFCEKTVVRCYQTVMVL
jgi:hypothetical protein